MAHTKVLKHRIRSVKNTRQITKAMELVAASKLRRVQEAAKSSQAYSHLAYSVLQRVSGSTEATLHPYFRTHQNSKAKLYIVFTADRGLAGAFNSNVQIAALNAIQDDQKSGLTTDLVVFGRRGARFFASISEVNLLAVYEQVADIPSPEVFAPLFEMIDESAKTGRYHSTVIVSTEFISTLSQSVRIQNLLPITPPEDAPVGSTYEFEPTPEFVLERAAQLYLQSQLMQAKVDSSASEHAMRMLAMSNATNNADELVDNLTLELNATRQAGITQEIAEITSGAEAMK